MDRPEFQLAIVMLVDFSFMRAALRVVDELFRDEQQMDCRRSLQDRVLAVSIIVMLLGNLLVYARQPVWTIVVLHLVVAVAVSFLVFFGPPRLDLREQDTPPERPKYDVSQAA